MRELYPTSHNSSMRLCLETLSGTCETVTVFQRIHNCSLAERGKDGTVPGAPPAKLRKERRWGNRNRDGIDQHHNFSSTQYRNRPAEILFISLFSRAASVSACSLVSNVRTSPFNFTVDSHVPVTPPLTRHLMTYFITIPRHNESRCCCPYSQVRTARSEPLQ